MSHWNSNKKTSFQAHYAGKCARDGADIEVDDWVGYHPDYDKVICNNCMRELADPPKCDKCFTVHKGECL